MASSRLSNLLHQLHQDARSTEVDAATDAQLMELFINRKDDAAFRVLVHRYGSMVFGVCLRLLRNHHDAEDAFQATFLVLARNAAVVRPREMVGNWLHGVARNISRKAKTKAVRRENNRLPELPERAETMPDLAMDLRPILDRELSGLPERYRLPIILCDLEGKSIKEAAGQLGWPQGSLAGRLARARVLLGRRLTRHGLHQSTGALAVILSPTGSSATPSASLVSDTLKACAGAVAGKEMASGLISPRVADLTNGGVTSMYSQLKVIGLSLVVVTLGIGLAAGTRGGEPSTAPAPAVIASPTSAPEAPTLDRAAFAIRAVDENILQNGGMEDGDKMPTHWSQGAEVEGVEYIWDKKTGYKSAASLCLHKTANRYFPVAQWHQSVERKGNAAELRLTARVKAEKATKATLDVIFLDDKDEWVSHEWAAYIGAKNAGQPPADHDWKEYSGKVKIPAGAKKIQIGLQIYGPGKIWFDDVRAEYVK